MLLFRKSKVLKILREYDRIYHQEIPEGAIGKEDLEALIDIELEQLAIMYDNLRGFEYLERVISYTQGLEISVKHHMPDRSRYHPSIRYLAPAKDLQHAVRVFKNVKFLTRNDFLAPEIYARSDGVFIEVGSTCWKSSLKN